MRLRSCYIKPKWQRDERTREKPADPSVQSHLGPASNTQQRFDSPRESSRRLTFCKTQVIINTHEKLCLACQSFKRGINKLNPLPRSAFVEGRSWRWRWALVLFASSSLIGPWCLAGISRRSGQDTSAT